MGEQMRQMEEVIYRARFMISDIILNREDPPCMAPAHKTKRSPPSPDTRKINFDGCFLDKEKTGAWGFLVRDHHVRAVLASAGNLPMVYDVLCHC